MVTKVSFYVVAHADDWQLFMQPNAYNDLMDSVSKVVFIITTAGDAGGTKAYWDAREEGCKSSIRFCMAPTTAIMETSGTKEFSHHTITYWSANNAKCYFLRLPDGNLDGKGFSSNSYQSLGRFRDGQIKTLSAIDGSATYDNWTGFSASLKSIIEFESNGITDTTIHYLNPDINTNPNDHADHVATGHAIMNMAIVSGMRQILYVGYSVGNRQKNLDSKDLFWKTGMFAAYEKAVYDATDYSTLRESVPTYLRWSLTMPDFITINP